MGRRGPQAARAHGLQPRRLAARGGPRVSVRTAAPPASAAWAQALTYLIELFAHIRVNVYVVHTVRHLLSAEAAAASCRSARRGSSSGSSGGGGARCVTSEARGTRRGRPGAAVASAARPLGERREKACVSTGRGGFFCVSRLGLGFGGTSQLFPETVFSRCV